MPALAQPPAPQATAKRRLIDRKEVRRITSLSESTIYEMMARNPPAFPRSVRIGAKRVAWDEAAVLKWIEDRLNSEASK